MTLKWKCSRDGLLDDKTTSSVTSTSNFVQEKFRFCARRGRSPEETQLVRASPSICPSCRGMTHHISWLGSWQMRVPRSPRYRCAAASGEDKRSSGEQPIYHEICWLSADVRRTGNGRWTDVSGRAAHLARHARSTGRVQNPHGKATGTSGKSPRHYSKQSRIVTRRIVTITAGVSAVTCHVRVQWTTLWTCSGIPDVGPALGIYPR